MPRSTKTLAARMPKPDAKLVEAAAEAADQSISSWCSEKLRRAALEDLQGRFEAVEKEDREPVPAGGRR